MGSNSNNPRSRTKTARTTKNSNQTKDGMSSNQVKPSAQSKAGLAQPDVTVQLMGIVEPSSMVGGPMKARPEPGTRPPNASSSGELAGTPPQEASPRSALSSSADELPPPPQPLPPVGEEGVGHAPEEGAGQGLEEGAGGAPVAEAGQSPGHVLSPELGRGLYANREARARSIEGNERLRLQLGEYMNLKKSADREARRVAQEAEDALLASGINTMASTGMASEEEGLGSEEGSREVEGATVEQPAQKVAEEEATVSPAPHNKNQVCASGDMAESAEVPDTVQPLQDRQARTQIPPSTPQPAPPRPREASGALLPEQLARGDEEGDGLEDVASPAARKTKNDARVTKRVQEQGPPRGCALGEPLRVTFQVTRPLEGHAETTVPLMISNIKRMCELAGVAQPNMQKGDDLASRWQFDKSGKRPSVTVTIFSGAEFYRFFVPDPRATMTRAWYAGKNGFQIWCPDSMKAAKESAEERERAQHMAEGNQRAKDKQARRRFSIRLKLGKDSPALTTAKVRAYLEWNFEEVHSMGPTANYHQGKAVSGLLSAEWDAVVTTHKPTRGSGVVLPKQLQGPDKGDPPIRFALAGFAVARDKEEQVARCVTCHQVGDCCSRGQWWKCPLYQGDMRKVQQTKRAEERRPKILSVDDLFMDLDTMKTAEEAQPEEWEGDMGQWQESDPRQQQQQQQQEGGGDKAEWGQQQQPNEFARSRPKSRQQEQWAARPEKRREEERQSRPHQSGGSIKRGRPGKERRRN